MKSKRLPIATLPKVATLALALLCSAQLAGCGGSVDDAAPTATRAVLAAGGQAQPVQNPFQLLRRMSLASSTVAHSGVRRVEQRWRVDTIGKELIYREQVHSDGAGQFAIEAIELTAPPPSHNEEAIFLALQQARAGFVRRYRDFAVRDVDAFQRNYELFDTGVQVTVAGRLCQEYLVQRVVDHAVRYWIAVDLEHALVLRCRHETAAGELLGLVEFESIDLAPNFSQVVWHQPVTDEAPLARDPAQARMQLGYEPRLPSTDGAHLRLLSASVVTAPDPNGGAPQKWAKHVLTDGVEVVFLLHGGPDPAPGRDDVVRVAPSVGPWNSAEGSLHGELFTTLGRVSVDELLDLLEAAL